MRTLCPSCMVMVWLTMWSMSIQVLQEVITNLDTFTMNTNLNGQLVQIFGKEWIEVEHSTLPQHFFYKTRTRHT